MLHICQICHCTNGRIICPLHRCNEALARIYYEHVEGCGDVTTNKSPDLENDYSNGYAILIVVVLLLTSAIITCMVYILYRMRRRTRRIRQITPRELRDL